MTPAGAPTAPDLQELATIDSLLTGPRLISLSLRVARTDISLAQEAQFFRLLRGTVHLILLKSIGLAHEGPGCQGFCNFDSGKMGFVSLATIGKLHGEVLVRGACFLLSRFGLQVCWEKFRS
jgi:hypothetical protein